MKIKAAKKEYAEKIAARMVARSASRMGDAVYKGYVKDLQKLNYATLFVLSTKVK